MSANLSNSLHKAEIVDLSSYGVQNRGSDKALAGSQE